MTRVTRSHFRALDICREGAEPFLEARGVSWAEFEAHGVDADWMAAQPSHHARAAAALAKGGMRAVRLMRRVSRRSAG